MYILAYASSEDDLFKKYLALSPNFQKEFKDSYQNEEWVYVASTDEYIYEINCNKIRTLSDGKIDVWSRLIANKKIPEGRMLKGDFIMKLDRYDCQKYTSKSITATTYNHKNGDLISTYDYPDNIPLKPVIPDSIGERKLNNVCFLDKVKKHKQQ